MLILTLVLYYIVACSVIPGEGQRRALVHYSLPTTEQHRPLSGPSPRNSGAVDTSAEGVPDRSQVRPVSHGDDARESSFMVNGDTSKASTEYRSAVIPGTNSHPKSTLHAASGRTSTSQTDVNRRRDFLDRDRHEEEAKNADRGTSYSSNSDMVRPVRRNEGDIRIPSSARKTEISSDGNTDRSERPITSASENGNERKLNQPGLARSETSEIDEHRFLTNDRLVREDDRRVNVSSGDKKLIEVSRDSFYYNHREDNSRRTGSAVKEKFEKGDRDPHDERYKVVVDDRRHQESSGNKNVDKGDRDSYYDRRRATVDYNSRRNSSDDRKVDEEDRDSYDDRRRDAAEDHIHKSNSDSKEFDESGRDSYSDRHKVAIDEHRYHDSSDDRHLDKGDRDSYDDRRMDIAEDRGQKGSSDNRKFHKSSRDSYSDRHKVAIDEHRYKGNSDDRHLDKGGRDSYDDIHGAEVDNYRHKGSFDDGKSEKADRDSHDSRHRATGDDYRNRDSLDDRKFGKGDREPYDDRRKVAVDDHRYESSSDGRNFDRSDKDSYDGRHKIREDDREHKIISDGRGHRIILDDGEHKIISNDGGHKIISDDGGHRIIADDRGHKIISDDGGHKITSDDRGHKIISDDSEHKIISDERGHHKIISDGGGHKIISDDRGLDKGDRGSYPDRHKVAVNDHGYRDNSNSRNLNKGDRNSYDEAYGSVVEVHRYKDGIDDRKTSNDGRHQDSVDDHIPEDSSDETKFDKGGRDSYHDRRKVTGDGHRHESSSDGRNLDKGDRDSYDGRHKVREDDSRIHDRSSDTERRDERDGKLISKEGHTVKSEETHETRDQADDGHRNRYYPGLKGELNDPGKVAAETLFRTELRSSETLESSVSSRDTHKADENSRRHGSGSTDGSKDKGGDGLQNRPLWRSENDGSSRPNQRDEKGPISSPNLRDTIIPHDEDGLNPRAGYPITSNTRRPKPDESSYRSPQRPLRPSSDAHRSTRSSTPNPPASHRSSSDYDRERHGEGDDRYNPTKDDPIIVRNQDMVKGDNGTERPQLAKSSRSNEGRITRNERGSRVSSDENRRYLKTEESVRTTETSRNAEKSDGERLKAAHRLSGSTTRTEGSHVYSGHSNDESLASNRRENKDISSLSPSSRSSERDHESRGNYSPTSNNNPPPRRGSARREELPTLSSDTQQSVNMHKSPERPGISNGSPNDQSRNQRRTESRVTSTSNAFPQGQGNRPILHQPANRNPIFNINNPRIPSTSTVPGNPHQKPLSPNEVIEASYRNVDTNLRKDVHYPVFDPSVHNMTSPGIIRPNERRGTILTTRKKRK